MEEFSPDAVRRGREATGARPPRSSPSRSPSRPQPLSLDLTAQRRLSDRAAFATPERQPQRAVASSVSPPPTRRIVGSVVVASPARADVEAFDRQRQARRGEAAAAAAASTAVPSLSRHSSSLSVRRLSLPSTPATIVVSVHGAAHTDHGRAASSGQGSHGSAPAPPLPRRWSNALRMVHTGSSFTVNSAGSGSAATRRRSTSVVSSAAPTTGAGGAQKKKAARRASTAAFDDTALDIDACRTMLEEAVDEGLDATRHSALSLSEGTFRQMQHNLARAVVALDKKRFAALLGLCRDISSALRSATVINAAATCAGAAEEEANDDDDDSEDTLDKSGARLSRILDSVIDPSTGYTIMHLVVLTNQTSLIHAALRHGSAVHSVEDAEGETALLLALRRAPEAVPVMMTLGKDVDVHRPMRMLVGQTHRALTTKILDKAKLIARWAALAKASASRPADTAADEANAALVPSGRNLLHAAVMADEATPSWPGRALFVQQLIAQHGLDAAQQDIFGFTPALLAREHALFLGTPAELQTLVRTMKAASLVQQLASATREGSEEGTTRRATTTAARARRETLKRRRRSGTGSRPRGGGGASTDDDDDDDDAEEEEAHRPLMSRLASFALSMRSATLLGVDEDADEDNEDGPASPRAVPSAQRPRARTLSHSELPLAQLAASLADLDAAMTLAVVPSVAPLTDGESSTDSEAPRTTTAAAAVTTPSPGRAQFEVMPTGTSPDAYVRLRLVSPTCAAPLPPLPPPPPPAHAHTAGPRAAPRLSAYVFPSGTDDDNDNDKDCPPAVSVALGAARVSSPLPQKPRQARPAPTTAPPAAVDARVFLSRSPPAALPVALPSHPLTLSPSPMGVRVASSARGSPRLASPSPGIPLAVEAYRGGEGGAGPGGVSGAAAAKGAVLSERVRARAAAVSAALSEMLHVRAVDRRRWRWLGPYARLACLVVVLVLHCISYALDVSCVYFREVRFGLWCRPLNLLFGDFWTGSAFFVGLTHVACLVVGAALGAVIVVLLIGRLCGCMLLKLPCFGAQDASEVPFLEDTFGLFVASFYVPHTRPRVFLLPLGLLLGVYSGALVYNALIRAAWQGQAWWALVPSCLSSYANYRTHFLALWATHLAINWFVLCFVADLCYQHGLLGAFLPHFLFDRWTNWLEVKVYPWCRRWGCLWPVQVACLRGRAVVAAAQARALAAQPKLADGTPAAQAQGAVHEKKVAASHPCAVLEEMQTVPVHVESYRLWFFWVALLVGWAVIALIFLLVGLLGGDRSYTPWYAQLGRSPTRRPPLTTGTNAHVGTDVAARLTSTSPFSAVKACLSVLFASCAMAGLCMAALQEWSWPVLLPHWHLSVPGLTVTGVHLGWCLWWWLFLVATFDGRQMVENIRALAHHRRAAQDNVAGLACGIVALVPAAVGVCVLLVCVGRTSLWRLESDDSAHTDRGEDKSLSASGKTLGSTQSTSLDATLDSSSSLRKSRHGTGTSSHRSDTVVDRRQVARDEDARRLWICRPDTLLEREPVPPLFGVLHYLQPDLPSWRTLLNPSSTSSSSSAAAADSGCAAAEAALRLLDAAVEALADGTHREADAAAHDRRLLALLVGCGDDDDDVGMPVRVAHTHNNNDTDDGDGSGSGGDCAPRLSMHDALQRRREHHARKRRECLNEVMTYAGGSTASATLAALGSTKVTRPPRPTRRTRRASAVRAAPALSSVRPPSHGTVAVSGSRPRASVSLPKNDRLHRRQQEVAYLHDMQCARDGSASPAPAPHQR